MDYSDECKIQRTHPSLLIRVKKKQLHIRTNIFSIPAQFVLFLKPVDSKGCFAVELFELIETEENA